MVIWLIVAGVAFEHAGKKLEKKYLAAYKSVIILLAIFNHSVSKLTQKL